MNFTVPEKVKKAFKALVLLTLLISLSINVIILKKKPCFGAVDLPENKYTKSGDPIVMTFGGHEYAVLDDSTGYELGLSGWQPLTKLYAGDYLMSVFDFEDELTVFGIKWDTDVLFLQCCYYRWYTKYYHIGPFGSPVIPMYLYRTDYELPELSLENVESIEFYAYEENTGLTKVFSETDKKSIKKWIDNYDILMTEEDFGNNGTDKTVYYVYAKFNGTVLRYDLGEYALDDFEISEFAIENVESIDFYIEDENNNEIKAYSETDKGNIEKWLNNYESFESADYNDYGIHKYAYRVCAKSIDDDLSYFLGYFILDDFENNKFPEYKQP